MSPSRSYVCAWKEKLGPAAIASRLGISQASVYRLLASKPLASRQMGVPMLI
jgi:DNA-binding transcriptional regulator LsrR (DeoR family)